MRALMEWDRLIAEGMSQGLAMARICSQTKSRRTTIFAWRRLVKGLPPSEWLPALAPRWKGRTVRAECSPEAWEVFKADYLRLEQPSARSCYDRLIAAGAERGWAVPSLQTLMRRIGDLDGALVTYLREGPKALARTYAAQKRSRAHFHALQGINGDGHTLDVWVTWDDGEVIRPVATVFQDLYSNKIVGWRIDKSESATAARLAFYDLVRDWGIPDFATLDNGRAWASKTMTGGQSTRFRFKVSADEVPGAMTALGVQVHWATPYSGQSKPIERAFRDLCDRIARHPAFAGAWAGNSPSAKPDYARIKPVPFETFMRVFAEGVMEHNARPGRRTEVAAGRSFDEAFAASYAASPIRKATAEQLRMAMLAAERVTARAPDGSLHLLGNRYWAEWLPHHLGARLTIRFDPDDLFDAVAVYGEDGRYLGEAECWAAVGFDSKEAAREHGRRRRAYLRHVREAAALEVTMSPADVAALQARAADPVPAPQAKVVRMITRSSVAVKADPIDQPSGMTTAEVLSLAVAALDRRMPDEP